MKAIWITGALGAALLLAACGGESEPGRTAQAPEPGAFFESADRVVAGSRVQRAQQADDGAMPAAEMDTGGGETDPALQQYIAYTYDFQMQFAAQSVEPAMQAHRADCMAAGADVCQVVSSSAFARNESHAQARLQIRAAPDWLRDFLGGLEEDVDAAGGEITASTMSSTDLSRPILDAEARLNAQRALRDRLTALLDRDDADLADLVSLERELARVQGGIESIESNLRNMRGRVTMSTVDLGYTSRVTVTSSGAVNPVMAALRDIVRNFSMALGAVITFVAVTTPWLILIIPVIWLLLRWRKRVNARKRAEKAV